MFRSLIRTGTRRNPATCGTNQNNLKRRFDLAQRAVELASSVRNSRNAHSLSVSLSLFRYPCLSCIHLSLSLCVYPCLSLCIPVALSVSLSLSMYACLCGIQRERQLAQLAPVQVAPVRTDPGSCQCCCNTRRFSGVDCHDFMTTFGRFWLRLSGNARNLSRAIPRENQENQSASTFPDLAWQG